MFALVFLALVVVAVISRLSAVVRGDRPFAAPRSHLHELDPHSTRMSDLLR